MMNYLCRRIYAMKEVCPSLFVFIFVSQPRVVPVQRTMVIDEWKCPNRLLLSRTRFALKFRRHSRAVWDAVELGKQT